MTPQRIQRKRTKGWRLPANTVCVTRGTRWGNPWRIGHKLHVLTGKERGQEITIDRKRAVKMFRDMLCCKPKAPAIAKVRAEIRECLAGKNLACWCKEGDLCHAAVLLEIANEK